MHLTTPFMVSSQLLSQPVGYASRHTENSDMMGHPVAMGIEYIRQTKLIFKHAVSLVQINWGPNRKR